MLGRIASGIFVGLGLIFGQRARFANLLDPNRGTIESQTDRYLSFDVNRENGRSTTAKLVVLDCLAKDRDGFLERVLDGNSYHPELQRRYLEVLAEILPGFVIGNYEEYKDIQGADEILSLATRHAPNRAIYNFEQFENASNAEEILLSAAQEDLVYAICFFHRYSDASNANEVLEVAAFEAAESQQWYVLSDQISSSGPRS